MKDPLKIGYIGIGLMGSPMAKRLLEAGYEVAIWGRRPAKLEPLYDAGATRAESPASLASNVDVLFLCVSDTAAVEDVMFGSDGAVRGVNGESIVVDMSSIEPARTIEMAKDLHDRTGAHWIDAPVSGGVPGATDGTLAIMCGAREQDMHRLKPVFEVLGRATRVGPVGSGQGAKLINQLIVACTMTVVAEATALAQASGIDTDSIPVALFGGRADSLVLQEYMPRMASRNEQIGSHLYTMVKDIQMIKQRAADVGARLPMLEQASLIHDAAVAMGLSDEDSSRIYDYYMNTKDSNK